MNLKQWLDKNEYTDATFARMLSEALGRPVKPQNVFCWKRGTMPAWDVGNAIGELTGGKVTPESFKKGKK